MEFCQSTRGLLAARLTVGELYEKTVSVLFLGYVAARKKNIFATQIKERRIKSFAPAGATQGAAPRPCDLFEKKVNQKLS